MIEGVIRSAAVVFITSGLMLTAYVSAWRLAGRGRFLARWVATIVALTWLPTALFHLLSTARLFSAGAAVIAVGILAAAVWLLLDARHRFRDWLARDRECLRRLGRLCRRSRRRWWVWAFFACAGPGLLRAVILPPLGWDTLTYHGVKAAMWVQNLGVDSMIGPGTWGYYRNMLAGGEVFMAWAMLPMHADTLTGAVEVWQWLALGFAIMVLARQLGVREPFASAAAGFVLAVPTVRLLPGSGYVELGLLLSLVGGLVLALEGIRSRPGLLVLAGAGFGVAAATKLPMVPIGGGLVLLLTARSFLRGTKTARSCALFGAAAFLVAVGPWLLLTYHRTGSFLSPFPIRVGGWALGEATPEVGWYLDRPVPAPSRLLAEAASLRDIFHLPTFRSEALGLLTLVPLAAAPFGFRAVLRRNRFGALLIGFVVAACALIYCAPGFAPIRYRWSDSSSRFLLPIVVLGVVAGLAGHRVRSARSRRFGAALLGIVFFHLLVYAVYGFSPVSLLGTAVLLVGLVALCTIAVYASRTSRVALRAAVLFFVAVVGIVGVESLRTWTRHDLMRMDSAIHVTPRYWVKALPMVDRPAESRIIALTSGPWQDLDNWFAYPFMGRRLQNTVLYVPVSGDGILRHFGRGDANDEIRRTASFDAWLLRLREQHVTEVMSFKPASVELVWMDERPDLFERLAGLDGYWGLYRLRGAGGSGS